MADSEQDAVVLAVDISVDGWKVSEASEYRHVVGVNAEYALRKVQLSWNEAVEEMRAEFGEAMDADDWAPPKDYVPLVLLNIDPQYLLGFAWIAHRRTHPQDTFAAWADEIPVGQLNTAFYEAMSAMAQEASRPPTNRAQRRASGPHSKTASPSATSCTGPSTTSTD